MENTICVSRHSIVVLRLMLSGIFIVAGSNHFLHTKKTVERITNASFQEFATFFGSPETLVLLSGGVMLVAGVSFLISFKTRFAALILLFVLLPITITVQIGQVQTLGPLFKNIAIFGGLLFFILNDLNTQKTVQS